MPLPNMKPAQLDEQRIARLRQMERDLGVCLVAWDVQTPYADLTPEQLSKLQADEKELGTIILAYQCRPR